MIIAIDGPSGAGKGTVARSVARALGFRHIDTGAMYRAVAWKALGEGVPLDDDGAVARLAEQAEIDVDDVRIAIDGVDITRDIRTPAIDRAAAMVARLPTVRRVLVARQRALGEGGQVVMEGRDIGTTVFPAADLKIFLDAESTERARRRAGDPAHQSQTATLASVATALEERDASDRTRGTSPLAVAPDAIHIDTTHMSIAAVVDQVLALARR